MPVCVCVKRGQVRRDDGHIRFYEEGEKETFKECPILFTELSNIIADDVDMLRVSEDILRDPDIIPLDRLVSFYNDAYGENLVDEKRNRVVDKIMYARHNPITSMSERGLPPLAHEFTSTTSTEPVLGSKAVEGDGDLQVELSDPEGKIPEPPSEDIDNTLDDLLGEGK